MSGIFFGVGIMYTLFMTLGSTTVYLNFITRIRENYFYSLVTFILLPLLIALAMTLTFGDIIQQWKEYSAMILPYFIVLIIYFQKFRKSKYCNKL